MDPSFIRQRVLRRKGQIRLRNLLRRKNGPQTQEEALAHLFHQVQTEDPGLAELTEETIQEVAQVGKDVRDLESFETFLENAHRIFNSDAEPLAGNPFGGTGKPRLLKSKALLDPVRQAMGKDGYDEAADRVGLFMRDLAAE